MNTTDNIDRLTESARQHGAANAYAVEPDSQIIMGALMRTDLVHVPLTDGERGRIVRAWYAGALREALTDNAERRLLGIGRRYNASWPELTPDEMAVELSAEVDIIERETNALLPPAELERLGRACDRRM